MKIRFPFPTTHNLHLLYDCKQKLPLYILLYRGSSINIFFVNTVPDDFDSLVMMQPVQLQILLSLGIHHFTSLSYQYFLYNSPNPQYSKRIFQCFVCINNIFSGHKSIRHIEIIFPNKIISI